MITPRVRPGTGGPPTGPETITGRRGAPDDDHRGAPDAGQRGAGLLGTLVALLVFLLLLLAAVQVLFNLYATSMVTSAGFEAARVVAGFDSVTDRCGAISAGEARFREALGRYGATNSVRLTWTCTDPDAVRVEVAADYPTILPSRLRGLTGLGHLDRVITIRVETRR